MTHLLVLLSLAAPTKAPKASVAPAAKTPVVNTNWLRTYGRFDAKNASWTLTIPTREQKGC